MAVNSAGVIDLEIGGCVSWLWLMIKTGRAKHVSVLHVVYTSRVVSVIFLLVRMATGSSQWGQNILAMISLSNSFNFSIMITT